MLDFKDSRLYLPKLYEPGVLASLWLRGLSACQEDGRPIILWDIARGVAWLPVLILLSEPEQSLGRQAERVCIIPR